MPLDEPEHLLGIVLSEASRIRDGQEGYLRPRERANATSTPHPRGKHNRNEQAFPVTRRDVNDEVSSLPVDQRLERVAHPLKMPIADKWRLVDLPPGSLKKLQERALAASPLLVLRDLSDKDLVFSVCLRIAEREGLGQLLLGDRLARALRIRRRLRHRSLCVWHTAPASSLTAQRPPLSLQSQMPYPRPPAASPRSSPPVEPPRRSAPETAHAAAHHARYQLSPVPSPRCNIREEPSCCPSVCWAPPHNRRRGVLQI